LTEVERRAYKQALFAVRDEHTALDIVQDAMMKLVANYAGKPVSELPMLFQRLLQNTIYDHFRRQKTRSLWTVLFSSLSPDRTNTDQDDHDPLETLEVEENGSSFGGDPSRQFEQSEMVGLIEEAIETLPARQREAFLLRYWEEMDLSETAAVMGCSEGSVKTHCSRATHALAVKLKERGVRL
jgi:RNA polymerase sigma-70 factor, ECF subfamily